MEAHINDVCLGKNTQEAHLILLGKCVSSCRRLCSIRDSTLAMGDGPLELLRPDPW